LIVADVARLRVAPVPAPPFCLEHFPEKLVLDLTGMDTGFRKKCDHVSWQPVARAAA
jgi:hypothetical protein